MPEPRPHLGARGDLLWGERVADVDHGVSALLEELGPVSGDLLQLIAYEKCYKVTGGYQNCVAAHEPLSYTDKYPLTKNSWMGPNGSRMAEITLAPGERTRKP